jgi:PAS domain S-box-containing protein
VVGLPFWETVWFKHTPGAPEAVRQAVSRAGAGEFIRYEAPLITPAGEAMAFDISLHPIRDEQGEVVLIVPEGRDITESKHAEELLRESEARLSAILQNTNAVIYLMDEESRFVHINRQFEELFNLKTETARGKSVYELFPKEFADAFVANNRRVLDEGQPLKIEETAPHLDGSVHTYLTVKVPHLDAGGKPIGIVGISTDITERKEAEEALRESEERFRALFDSIDEGFCIVEMIFDEANKPVDYRFVQVNPAMERLTGLTNALGKTARELVPNLEEFWFETYGKVALTGQAARFENKSAPMNRWFDVHASRIGDATSRRVAIVFNNITERKRAELEREEMLEREQVLRREAEQANRLKDEFLATASHELRTPLTAIVGWTRMLRAGNLDEAMTARALETVERNADAQTKLIEDLLDISRIITGKLNLDKQLIELAPVIADAVNTVRPAAEAKGIEIETAIDSSALAVLADAHRIQQVVWNLLSNAVKFTPAEGRVEVALRRVDAQVEISVRDTGEGIEPEFLPYVFDRFRQADGKTTRKHGGLGLGLAIVRQLAEMHGGEVKAHSDGPGRGAVFSLRLPLLGAHTPLASRAADPARPETAIVGSLTIECSPSLDGLRVLVVDDDSDTREMLDAVLSECAAEVVTAANAAEAVQEIARRRPDVLVSDIGMPEEDGYDLIKKIRAMEATRGDTTIPALALTAYAKAEDRVRALASGYQAHLSKPVEPAEFALVVANLVGRGKTAQDRTHAD